MFRSGIISLTLLKVSSGHENKAKMARPREPPAMEKLNGRVYPGHYFPVCRHLRQAVARRYSLPQGIDNLRADLDDALIRSMPDLTRRPDPHRADCWLIYFGDVHVGTVARAVGTPNATVEWRWQCGFYPRMRRGGASRRFGAELRPSALRFRTRLAHLLRTAD
jgi:hypothetical protein